MARKRIDLTGQRFGRWTAIKPAGNYYDFSGHCCSSVWLCQCDCGTVRKVLTHSLRNGTSTSCGCQRRERMSDGMYAYHKDKAMRKGVGNAVF